MLNPHGEVVDTKEIASAEDAHAWFVDAKADNSELGWRMEVDVLRLAVLRPHRRRPGLTASRIVAVSRSSFSGWW